MRQTFSHQRKPQIGKLINQNYQHTFTLYGNALLCGLNQIVAIPLGLKV